MAGGIFFKKKAGCCLGRGGIPPKKVFTPPKYTNKKYQTSGGMTGCLGIDGLPSV